MNKAKKAAVLIFGAAFSLFCLTAPVSAKTAVHCGIMRCLNTVIPSLYAMMIAAGLLIRTGAVSAAGRVLSLPGKLFGMNGETFAAFLFSMTAGYPVGARLLYGQYRGGQLTGHQIRLYSGVCFGAGSAFISGCASSGGSAGKLLLLSTIAANIVTALLMSPLFRRECVPAEPRRVQLSGASFADAVSSAGRSMAEICLAVISFSVITEMLRSSGLLRIVSAIPEKLLKLSPDTAEKAVCALLDVTAISGLSDCGFALLPLKAALISFGGICVFIQIGTVFRGDVSLLPLILTRTFTAVLSYIICRGLLPAFMSGETVAASAMRTQLHQSSSPVPSVLLMIMTAALLFRQANINKTATGN